MIYTTLKITTGTDVNFPCYRVACVNGWGSRGGGGGDVHIRYMHTKDKDTINVYTPDSSGVTIIGTQPLPIG